ncbi:MAG: glycine dehydrogenase (aminomethyl-transferring) [Proteobacteria bacterium]|nr:MAG: glycine dehydrogenase (aminomethyl-transferring) [Pseudomonadota bacterium]
MQLREPLVFEISRDGRTGHSLPLSCQRAVGEVKLPEGLVRERRVGWPEVSEVDAVRHFVRLSQQNYGIDVGFFPLGSCTMKYNPKVNEQVARLAGFTDLHPWAPASWVQGALRLYWELERLLAEITGFAAVSLQPAAGAHGEFTGLRLIKDKLLRIEGRPRTKVLIPDTAHGTNPATCKMNGYRAVPIHSSSDGIVTPEAVAAAMDEDVAAIMVTNPNTLGLFETHMAELAEIVHAKGGYVYGDGANMNALLGRARPGDMGVDVMHLNLHKTFSTPHGGGGPGSGPVCVTEAFAPHLPVPRVVKEADGSFSVDLDRPQSIGRVKAFFGNFGMHVRAYTYIRELGAEGLRDASGMAVLNANYLKARLAKTYNVVFDRACMHEVVLNDKRQRHTGAGTRDIAKALIDEGFHPPTMFFPICVNSAIMVEPTETESRETLDAFVAAMERVDARMRDDAEAVKAAPERPLVGRLDEARAVRQPILRWTPPLD